MNNKLPIGVFDSGMGGLTVLRELIKQLPNESFVYLGDTARLPYGTKSRETIMKYSEQAVNKLLEIDVKMIIVACNTATVSSLDYLQDLYKNIPIIGVVKPGAIASARQTKTNHIGLIATERTVLSGCYEASLNEISSDFIITSKQCNIFTSLAEEGHIDDEIARIVIHNYITDLLAKNQLIDTVLLGCTHFPVFRKMIKNLIPSNINVVDSAECTAEAAVTLLNQLEIINPNTNNDNIINYYVTDSPERFKKIGKLFLGRQIDDVKLI